MIAELIDKQDSFEVIRDQIAGVLLSEVANQMALATAASKDPEEWNLSIYAERSNPWEAYIDDNAQKTPIVNIWYDNSNFDLGASNTMERQKAEAVFNIDCYGFGVSERTPGGGHTPGDYTAALQAQKALRLVRNILMSAEYVDLGLPGLVWDRKIQSINVFQPRLDDRPTQNIVGSRIAFMVVFNEFSPQIPEEILELVSIDWFRSADGKLILETDIEYPL